MKKTGTKITTMKMKTSNCKLLPDNRSCVEKALEGMEKLIKQYNVTFLPVGGYDQDLEELKRKSLKEDYPSNPYERIPKEALDIISRPW